MSEQRPNIIFVLVDELRFPVHFPKGIPDSDQFMARFMPNTYRLLWSKGVRFDNYFTSASDCSPARGTVVTGLYSQQTYCMATRASGTTPQTTSAPQPSLDPAFPTYGKLLRDAGYDTPYAGKWHLSDFPAGYDSSAASWYLNDYGFEGLTIPDAVGLPGQGCGATPGAPGPVGATPPPSDAEIANTAVTWLQARAKQDTKRPFCLTVGFVNPHDKQFFWGGIDATRYRAMYDQAGLPAPMGYTFDTVRELYPPSYGYDLPDNWQSGSFVNEPHLHSVFREVTNGLVGSIGTDNSVTGFSMVPSPIAAYGQNAMAPYHYWNVAQDMYTQAMSDVDVQIGQVVQNIPPALLANTIVVFTSDHGEYASAHGLQGKGMSVFQETMHLPFCFTDFTGRYATTPGSRSQFASHVDLLPMFGNIGYGDSSWMNEPAYKDLYAKRNDLLAVVQNPGASVVRPYCLYAADEVLTAEQNFAKAPEHVLGYVDAKQKLGVYSRWQENGSLPQSAGQELEYYDYGTEKGRLELESLPTSGAARALSQKLLQEYLPNELQAPLPERYQAAQQSALENYWTYVKLASLTTADAALTL